MASVIFFKPHRSSGGAYIPLDPSHPPTLLSDIFSDAKPACVITNATMESKLKGEET